jgi:DNA-binding transcriptional ArsR family regulator
MEGVIWYVLTGTRGGPNRVRLLRAVDRRPRNANQLADTLELDYTTVRHHLDVLVDNGMVRSTGDDYGAVYLPTDRLQANWETVEEVVGQLDADLEADGENTEGGTRE